MEGKSKYRQSLVYNINSFVLPFIWYGKKDNKNVQKQKIINMDTAGMQQNRQANYSGPVA